MPKRVKQRVTQWKTLAVAVTLGLFACTGTPASSELSSAKAQPSRQAILKLKGAADGSKPEILAKLTKVTGVEVRYVRSMAGGAHVVALPGHLTGRELERAVGAIAELPEVEYVEADRLKTHY